MVGCSKSPQRSPKAVFRSAPYASPPNDPTENGMHDPRVDGKPSPIVCHALGEASVGLPITWGNMLLHILALPHIANY
jgi:hypothetical protein